MRYVPNHPLAPTSGIVAVARLRLYEKIGSGPHPCHWCSKPIAWMPGKGLIEGALVVDHLDWDRKNDAPENLVPSCNQCNAHRTRQGDRRLITDDDVIIADGDHRRRAVARLCEVCGAPFLARADFVRRGGARFCSRQCAGVNNARARWG